MAAAELPLTLAELDAALAAIGGFEPQPLLAVGVSGGPDSLALMILADRWARRRGGAAWALIVDHRLRAKSGVEAETVGSWLAARRIPYAVLAWCGKKPATGIQEAARAARYRLLAEWCAARGCLHLLTAHHRDDQAETYLIRRRAGSGIDGLSGMASVRELPQLRLVRPLLGVAKARLVALLDAEGQQYLRDPSNRNPAFERSRLRMEMEEAAHPAGGEAVRASRQARTHASARIERERQLAALLARAVSLHPAGFAVIDPALIVALGQLGPGDADGNDLNDLAERAVDRVAAVIGGAAYPIRRERLLRLRQSISETPMRTRTLGGCRFVAWRGRVLALREAARAAPLLPLAPGKSVMWDGRFAARLPATAGGPVGIGPLGDAGVAALGRSRRDESNPLPRLVYPSLPAVWDQAGLAAVPHLRWRRPTAGCMPVLTFRPLVPLFSAGFTVV